MGKNALRMCDEGAKQHTAFRQRAREGAVERRNQMRITNRIEGEREKVCGGGKCEELHHA